MRDSIRTVLAALAFATVLLGVAACEQKGPAERAGEHIDQAGEQAADAVRTAGDKAKDAVN